MCTSCQTQNQIDRFKMSYDLSFQDMTDCCDLLSCTDKAKRLATFVAKTHESNTSGAFRVLVQATFCQALLKSLQPTKSAAVLDNLSTHHQQQTPSERPSPPSNSNISQNHVPAATATTAAGGAELADAWISASQALELIYAWEDEEVVVSVINFWGQLSSLLCGSWLQHSQQQPSTISNSQDPSHTQQANPSAAAAHAPTNPSTAAAAAGPLQALSTPELQYLSWLWSLGPAAVAAVVQQLHSFWRLTGINHLQHKHTQQHNKGPAHHLINLLLLFLDLHSRSGPSGGSSSSGCFSSSQPAAQLLQLLYAGSAYSSGSIAAVVTAAEAFSGVSCLLQAAAVLGITLPPPTAAAAAADSAEQPPQDVDQAAAAAAGDDTHPEDSQPDSSTTGVTAWPVLAAAAGELLRDCYGWCGFGEAANASPAEAAAAAEAARHAAAGFSSRSSSLTVARPSVLESLYDCFMMLLLQQMMQGPDVRNSKALGHDGTTARQLQGSQAATAAAAQSEDDWESWVDSAAFNALAALVASYDRPDVLARGLHMLTQQQLLAVENAAAAIAAAAAEGDPVGTQGLNSKSSQAASKKADKSAMGRALLLLERVFLWRQQQQATEAELSDSSSSSAAAAAAGGVCQLLLGLSELLRPAANCSVEWRCAALASMQLAVEDFTQNHPDDGDLELQLWCDTSVEGLIYCASHDPSIQARRAAVQLLQHVVLPNSSTTARALIRCLAEKLSDKDSGVAGAALQLFVQLHPRVLCSCLTATQWCTAVQACLGMVCGASSGGAGTQSGLGGKGGRQQERGADAALKEQFVALLRKVLQGSASADGQAQQQQQQQQQHQGGWQWLMTQGGRVVGVEGCRQVLLMLLMEPGLGDQWQALVEGVR